MLIAESFADKGFQEPSARGVSDAIAALTRMLLPQKHRPCFLTFLLIALLSSHSERPTVTRAINAQLFVKL
jgi:hypothetical protein